MERFPGETYQIEACVLRELYALTCRLNDGMKMSPDERRDMAQRFQALLSRAELLY